MPNYKQIIDNGPASNRINIVIIGDGYTSSELDSLYPNHYNSIINDMFANQAISEPFSSYAKYFNVYAISISSMESGADQPLKSITVDTALNSSFSWGGSVERLLSFDAYLANTAMSQAFKGTNISPHMKIGIVNTSKYGGAGGTWAISYATDKANLLLHEIGHSYVGLADEYESTGGTVPTSEPSELNVTMDSTGSKWSHWMGYDDGILGPIGVFEGGKYTSTGVYRPTKSSMMRDLSKPFDAIAQEEFILQFYTDIDHADDYSLKGTNYKGTDYIYSVGESVNGGKSSSSGRGTKNPVTFTEVNHSDTIYARWLGWDGTPGTKYKLWNGWKWELDVKDVLRIEDSSGNVLADIDCTGDKYVVNADGTISQTNGTHAMQFISEGDFINNPGAFLVDPLDTDKISIEWTVAGNKLDSKKGKYSLEVQNLNLSNGTHKVTATLEDPTNKVRKSNNIMKKTIDWEIKIDNSNATWTTDGTFGDDTINLGDGNDVVTGQEGNDTINGGKGNDTITGGEGNDIINGGAGNDIIDGGVGNDTINGGEGNDVLKLEADGIWGKDFYAANVSSFALLSTVSIEGKNKFQDVLDGGKNDGNEADTVLLTDKDDVFSLDDAFSGFHQSLSLEKDLFSKDNKARIDAIEKINGGAGDDVIDLTSPTFTLSENILIEGGTGNDVIWASKGKDTLKGEQGNDILFGGAGDDILTGGSGSDTFEFFNQSGNDIIKDYNKADGDKLAFYIQSGDNQNVSFSGETITWGSIQIQLEGLTISSTNDFLVEYNTVA